MRNCFFLFFVMLCTVSLKADKVYINNFSINSGETVTISLMLDNEIEYKSLQCDFEFPEGLSIVCNESNQPVFTATDRTPSHMIRGSRLDGTGANHYRIGMITTANAIASGSGPVATFQVSASEGYYGDKIIEITDISVGDVNNVSYTLSNTACTVTIVDGSTHVENLYDDAEMRSNVRYNILGQRVNETYKGVIVVDGKKILVR